MTQREYPPGTEIAAYRIVSVLGRGGMGVVYEAEDRALGRRVAIKVVKRELALDERARKRFQREASGAAAVAHENVARIFFVGLHEGAPFMVLELLPGGSLRDVIKTRGALPWREVVALGAGIARGLGAVHAAGLVHRDLKPENVLLDEDGRPKLTDFGLVRSTDLGVSALTKTGELLGTLEYMAPEQSDGSNVDFRADLYSLGATLHHMLAGRPPFEGEGYALVTKHLQETPASLRTFDPRVPLALDALVLRLLSKFPGHRGSGASEVADELEAIAAGRGSRRGKKALVAIGLLVALAAGGAVFFAPRGIVPETKLPTPGEVKPLPGRPVPSGKPQPMTPYKESVHSAGGAIECLAILGSPDWNFVHEVSSVAVSPDGLLALMGDAGGTLHLIELPSGRELFFARGHSGWVRAVAISPDGTLALSGDEGEGEVKGSLRLWDLVEHKLIWKVPTEAPVRCVRFSPDGVLALSCGEGDVAVRLWNVNTGRAAATLDHEASVRQAVFLAGGTQILTAGRDGVIRLWDRARKTVIRRFEGHTEEVCSIAVSEETNEVLSGASRTGDRPTEVLLWDFTTGKVRMQFSQGNTACTVAFVPGSHRVVSTENQPVAELNVWDTRTGRLVGSLAHRHSVYDVAVTRDGHALTASGDRTLGFWNLNGLVDARPVAGHGGSIDALAVTPDGNRALSGGRDGQLTIWDHSEGQKLTPRLLEAHAGGINGLALSKDGKQAVSVGEDHLLKEWDLETGSEIRPLTLRGYRASPLRSVALSPDDRFAVAGAANGACLLFDREAAPGAVPAAARAHTGSVTFAGFREDQRLVTASEDGTVLLWQPLLAPGVLEKSAIRLDTKKRRSPGDGAILSAAISPTGTFLAGSADGTLWSGGLDTGAPAERASHRTLTAVGVSASGGRFLSAGQDGILRLWNNEGGVLDTIDLGASNDHATKIVFEVDWRVFVGTARGVVYRLQLRKDW